MLKRCRSMIGIACVASQLTSPLVLTSAFTPATSHRGAASSRPFTIRAFPSTPAAVETKTDTVPKPSAGGTGGAGNNAAVSWYLKTVSKHALLRAEEEVMLARKIQAMLGFERVKDNLKETLDRDPTWEEWAGAVGMEPAELRRKMSRGRYAKKAMISSNLRLVISIAKRYQNRGLSFQDLIQEGSLGLVRAVEKFDPEKGFKFSTYSTWWIKQAVLRAIADQSRTIRLPVHVHDMLNSIKKHTRELTEELGRTPSEEEIAARMDLTMKKLRFLRDASRPAMSMEATRQAGGGKKGASGGTQNEVQVADSIKDSNPCPDQITESKMLKDDVSSLVCTLSPREQDVIRMRFGLDSGKPKTLEEIGNVFCVTRERVRQIEARALHKLRQPYRNFKLREYAINELKQTG